MRLVPHDPAWLEWFAAESIRIRNALQDGALRIEHIGSTSVAGLLAKPIIDIAVVTPGADGLAACVEPLIGLGYGDRGQNGDDPLRRYFVLERDGRRIAQLHLWTRDAPAWRLAIAFRDLLRRRPDLRVAYAEEKLRVADAVAWDKKEYSTGKGRFIQSVLRSEAVGTETG